MLYVKNLRKSYQSGNKSYSVLKGIDLSVASQEFVAVMGPSGSGKSTLLNCISCYIPFEEGEISLGGQNLKGLGEDALARIRNEKLGFVFQDFMLLDGLPILAHTINNFAEALPDAEIVVVLPADYIGFWQDYARRFDVAAHRTAAGGAERFHSVANGIAALSDVCTLIGVQDGVRPLAAVFLKQTAQQKEIVRLLIAAGADPSLADRPRQSAFDFAEITQAEPALIALLEEANFRLHGVPRKTSSIN